MKLLHVTPTYLPAIRYGGPIVAVHGLCKALAARGHEVDVFTTNVDGDSVLDVPVNEPVLMDGVRVRYFPSSFPRLYFSRAMPLHEIAQYDLVHSHAVYLWPGVAAARAARRHGVPYVISPRGMLVPELIRGKSRLLKTAWLQLIERRALAGAAAIHFTSQLEWDDARRTGLPLPSPFVVPNGIDVVAKPDVPREENTLVFLGRINWKKGLERVIEALPSLPGTRFIIAGNDEEGLTPRLEELARSLGVFDRVEFAGPVYGQAKWELLARATLFILLSNSENFGNAVLEALAMETPVVLSEGVGLAEDVVRADAGAIGASAIAGLLRDGARRAEMGRNGRALVESRFTWGRVAEEMEEAYQRAGGGTPPSQPAGRRRSTEASFPDQITPLILTKDEEPNIGRTLAQLAWASEVIVVDSLSSDRTVEIARTFPNVRVVQREIDSLAGQSNFGIAQAKTPWVMLMDADYFVPDAFVDELRTLQPPPNVHAYVGAFTYAIHGKPLRATLYPPRVVLLHRQHARVWQDGHAHRTLVDGETGTLRTRIIHDDRKSFARFVERQRKYMRQEADKLRAAGPRTLNLAARIRKLIVIAPFAVAIHALFVKGLILDGWPGLVYTWERFVAELILSRELLRRPSR